MWITFLRRFWGVFLGGFWEPIGPGAGVRADFSAEGVLLVRWAGANFDFFRGFFPFLVRFLPVFRPYFALFSSMSCAYLYVNNYFSASLAWNVHTSNRKGRKARKGRIGEPGFVPARRDYAVAGDTRRKSKPPKGRRWGMGGNPPSPRLWRAGGETAKRHGLQRSPEGVQQRTRTRRAPF